MARPSFQIFCVGGWRGEYIVWGGCVGMCGWVSGGGVFVCQRVEAEYMCVQVLVPTGGHAYTCVLTYVEGRPSSIALHFIFILFVSYIWISYLQVCLCSLCLPV